MPDEPSAPGRPLDLLRSLARTLGRAELAQIAAYVVLSLATALAGSLAAVLLVPLVQPGHALPLAGGMFDVGGGVERRAAAFAAATVAFAVLRWLVAWLGARLTSRYGVARRREVHARLVDAPLAALADSSSAEIANVLTYNVEFLAQGFAALLQLLVAGLTTIVSLGFAFGVSPPLMLATPLLAGFALVASRSFGREQSQVGRRYVADMTRLFWFSEEFPRRLRHIRSFGRADAEKAGYAAISAALGQGYRRQLELVAAGRLVLELLAALAIAAVFVLAWRWHGVDQSSLIAVCLLLGRLLPYLVSSRQSFQQLRSAVPAFALWQRYMDLGTAPAATPPPGVVAQTQRPALLIERIRLAPPLAALEVQQLGLRPGELTLVCGDSGIGKSSLVDVLAGMGVPAAFAARVDGRAIGFGEYRELVRHGAYVSQGVRPWQPTVRECLRWAAPEAGEARMRSALRDVGLGRRVCDSPPGLDTTLHDPAGRLSGGELQRLLLAQVLLRQPFLAVLDEATSALDAASEIQVLATLKRRLPQTILVVVSHRSSVAAVADQCLGIDGDLAATVAAKVGPYRAVPQAHDRLV